MHTRGISFDPACTFFSSRHFHCQIVAYLLRRIDMYFGLQFMELYPSHQVPFEATRDTKSPSQCFRTLNGWRDQTWHVTRISLICKRDGENMYTSLCQLDPIDETISSAYRCLLASYEDSLLRDIQDDGGLSQIVNECFYIIAFSWSVFLKQAEEHLEFLVWQQS